MIENEKDAREFCAERCENAAIDRLDAFVELLAAENQRQNLVSRGSLESVWQRHIADSLQLLDHVPRGTTPWLDLGSGAGMPGLVLALARPDLEIVLVESRKKRIDWLAQNVDHFRLKNCVVRGSRVEHVETMPTGVITARAFAPLGKCLKLSARFSTRSTVCCCRRGGQGRKNCQNSRKRFRTCFTWNSQKPMRMRPFWSA